MRIFVWWRVSSMLRIRPSQIAAAFRYYAYDHISKSTVICVSDTLLSFVGFHMHLCVRVFSFRSLCPLWSCTGRQRGNP
jgi:hypothetical protein